MQHGASGVLAPSFTFRSTNQLTSSFKVTVPSFQPLCLLALSHFSDRDAMGSRETGVEGVALYHYLIMLALTRAKQYAAQ